MLSYIKNVKEKIHKFKLIKLNKTIANSQLSTTIIVILPEK